MTKISLFTWLWHDLANGILDSWIRQLGNKRNRDDRKKGMDLSGAALIWLTGRLSTEKRWLAIQVPRRAPCKYKGIWRHLGPNETSVQLHNKTTSSDFFYELNRGSQSAKHLLLSFSKDACTQQDDGHFWHVLTAHCGEWWNKKEQLQRAVRWRAAADRLHTSNLSVRQVFPFTVPCCLWTWAVRSRKSDHSYSKDDGKKANRIFSSQLCDLNCHQISQDHPFTFCCS